MDSNSDNLIKRSEEWLKDHSLLTNDRRKRLAIIFFRTLHDRMLDINCLYRGKRYQGMLAIGRTLYETVIKLFWMLEEKDESRALYLLIEDIRNGHKKDKSLFSFMKHPKSIYHTKTAHVKAKLDEDSYYLSEIETEYENLTKQKYQEKKSYEKALEVLWEKQDPDTLIYINKFYQDSEDVDPEALHTLLESFHKDSLDRLSKEFDA